MLYQTLKFVSVSAVLVFILRSNAFAQIYVSPTPTYTPQIPQMYPNSREIPSTDPNATRLPYVTDPYGRGYAPAPVPDIYQPPLVDPNAGGMPYNTPYYQPYKPVQPYQPREGINDWRPSRGPLGSVQSESKSYANVEQGMRLNLDNMGRFIN